MDKEKLAGNIFTIIPFMFKKLMKTYPSSSISKQQLGLLFHTKEESGKPMSYYSEKMMIPKSNLTIISDKLIKEDLIKRAFDPNDRRIITLEITEKGKKYLSEIKEVVIQSMVKRFDSLTAEEVRRLNELIEEMKEIFDKVD